MSGFTVVVNEELSTVTVTSPGPQGAAGPDGPAGPPGPQGEPGVGAPIYGQVAKLTSGTITIANTGVYQSTGLTAILDGEADGIALGTTDTFAVKNVSGATRRLKISASYDASMAGATRQLGLGLAVGGVFDPDTECRATTGQAGAIAKLATAWIIDLADGAEVSMVVANFTNDNSIQFQRGRIVAISVAGFGPQGDAATVDAGTTTTLPAGSPATVANSGTTSAAIFDFGIPEGDKGDKGDQGDPGAAATIAAGTTTTLSPGASATVANSGTSSAAVFDFGIPEGLKGDTGDTGPTGPPGTVVYDDVDNILAHQVFS
jgi:hypothetical protein